MRCVIVYELWGTDSGNLISTSGSEQEALDLVRRMVAIQGPSTVASWTLMHVADLHDEAIAAVAAGLALVQRAGISA